MASSPQNSQAGSDLLFQNHREVRDLGDDEPGMSLPRGPMRMLGLLDEEGGVDTDTEALVAVYEDGRVVIDLQIDA